MLYWFIYRKVNPSPIIVFQRHRFQMGGKEIVDSMQLGSLGEGSLVHPQIP